MIFNVYMSKVLLYINTNFLSIFKKLYNFINNCQKAPNKRIVQISIIDFKGR